MCGILGILSLELKFSTRYLVKKLSGLEYRGYDSVGIAYSDDFNILSFKTIGDTLNLKYPNENINIAIGHTRWATHGSPLIKNCHPHLSNDKKIAIVHNGIIDNYKELKSKLDYTFESDTDSEVIAHLTHYYLKYNSIKGLPEFLKSQLIGSYAIIILINHTLIGICNKSPLLVGFDGQKYFLTSDVSILKAGTRFKSLQDGDFIFLNQKIFLKDIDFLKDSEILKNTTRAIGKNHTWNEIHDQANYEIPDITDSLELIKKSKKIIFLGCGTSRHACLMGQKYLKRGRVEYPSEYVYDDEDLIICVSQSGETIDLISVIKNNYKKNIKILSIINRENSSLERISNLTILMNCGAEFGVASTKAFTSTVMIFYKISCQLFSNIELKLDLDDIFKMNQDILEISHKIKDYKNLFYLGSGIDYPIALEGSLKFKEITYLHAEGYLTSEMKHGPIALLDETFCTVIINSHNFQSISNTIQELKSRNSRVVNVSTVYNSMADDNLIFSSVSPELDPVIINIILQLLAFHTAVKLNRNIDKPRNLAKSVTVH